MKDRTIARAQNNEPPIQNAGIVSYTSDSMHSFQTYYQSASAQLPIINMDGDDENDDESDNNIEHKHNNDHVEYQTRRIAHKNSNGIIERYTHTFGLRSRVYYFLSAGMTRHGMTSQPPEGNIMFPSCSGGQTS